MRKLKPLTAHIIKQIASVDTASKRSGVFTVRREFFYTHGKTAQDFADRVAAELQEAGYKIDVVDKGEKWAAFRGGASTANSSHWWVKFTDQTKSKV